MSRAELTALVRRQDGQITTLSTQVADLLAVNEKLARLEYLLSRNSGDSSMPPSKDDDPGRTPPRRNRADRRGPNANGASSPARRAQTWPGCSGPITSGTGFPHGRCQCCHDLAEATDMGIVDRYRQHEIPQVIPGGAGPVTSVSITTSTRCGAAAAGSTPPSARRAPAAGW